MSDPPRCVDRSVMLSMYLRMGSRRGNMSEAFATTALARFSSLFTAHIPFASGPRKKMQEEREKRKAEKRDLEPGGHARQSLLHSMSFA